MTDENTGGVAPIPDGFHTLAPHLVVSDAAAAIDFYSNVFGAVELFRLPFPEGKIMHAELQIGQSRLMLCDHTPASEAWREPKALGGSSVTIHLWSEDADATFAQAIEAGATVEMPLSDTFWGDRYGKLVDPFGHVWAIATHVKDVSPLDIMVEAAKQFGTAQ